MIGPLMDRCYKFLVRHPVCVSIINGIYRILHSINIFIYNYMNLYKLTKTPTSVAYKKLYTSQPEGNFMKKAETCSCYYF
jgi:hypothetical protein